MFVTQLLVAAAIATLGFVSPRDSIWTVAALTTLAALFGASSNIAIDAYRRELLRDTEQGLGNAVHVNAYKIAALVPGSLSLVLSDHLPWTHVFMVTAAFMLPGIAMTLLMREPAMHGAPPRNLRDVVILPFREFLARGRLAQRATGARLHLRLQARRRDGHCAVHLRLPRHRLQQDPDRRAGQAYRVLGQPHRRHLAGQDRHRARPVDPSAWCRSPRR